MLHVKVWGTVLGLWLPFKRKGAHRCWAKSRPQECTGSTVVALPKCLLKHSVATTAWQTKSTDIKN